MWKETVKNSSIVLAGVILSRLFVFLYNTIVIRELSVSDYALFAFALSVFNWVLVFSHLDLYAAVSCSISRFKAFHQISEAWSSYGHAFIMAGLFSIFGIIVALLIANSQEAYSIYFLAIFMLSLLPMSLVTVNDGYLKGLEKFRLSALVEVSGGFSKLLVLSLALLIIQPIDLSVVLFLFTIAAFLMFIVSSICILTSKPHIILGTIQLNFSTAKALFNYSKWVCLTDLMNAGILLTGNLILSQKSPRDLALFNVVILIYSIFQIGFGAITTVLIPQVSRQNANKQNVRALGIREFSFVAVLTTLLIFALAWFPWRHDILLFLFNKQDYVNAFEFLAILLIAFPFRLFSVANKSILQGIGQPKIVAFASIATLLTNISLFIPFYDAFSLAGAMMAMVCAYLVEFTLTSLITHRILGQRSVSVPSRP